MEDLVSKKEDKKAAKAEVTEAAPEKVEEKPIDETLLNGGYLEALAEATAEDKRNKRTIKSKLSAVAELPSPDKIRAEVAKRVLVHLEKWPAKIVELVGDEHPNQDSFVEGIPYILRAYMTIALRKAESITTKLVRKAELEAAGNIGPIASQLNKTRSRIFSSVSTRTKELKAQRDKELREAEREIKARYGEQIKVEQAKLSEDPEVCDLENKINIISSTFEETKEARQRELLEVKISVRDVMYRAEEIEAKEKSKKRAAQEKKDKDKKVKSKPKAEEADQQASV